MLLYSNSLMNVFFFFFENLLNPVNESICKKMQSYVENTHCDFDLFIGGC